MYTIKVYHKIFEVLQTLETSDQFKWLHISKLKNYEVLIQNGKNCVRNYEQFIGKEYKITITNTNVHLKKKKRSQRKLDQLWLFLSVTSKVEKMSKEKILKQEIAST